MEITLLIMEKSWNLVFEFLWEPWAESKCVISVVPITKSNDFPTLASIMVFRYYPTLNIAPETFVKGITT